MFFSKIKNILDLWSKNNAALSSEEEKICYPFSKWHIERHTPVLFMNEETGASKVIVDEKHRIYDFPGIENEQEIKKYLSSDFDLKPYAEYGSCFERYKDEYVMYWTVQPDGRYWEDEDGFGGTSDPEVILYSLINKDGNFTGPFRLYRVGTTRYEITD